MDRSGSRPRSRLLAATAVGGPITRAEVIARAKYWYDRDDTWYSQDQADAISNGTGGEYRPDCSGLAAMAWHLPKKIRRLGPQHRRLPHLRPQDLARQPARPAAGDALLREGHMELFEKWVDQDDHTKGAWVYSENDYGQMTNHNTNDWAEMNTCRGIRYDKILDGARDFSGDGNADVLARHAGDYDLYLYKGNGSGRFVDAPR